jgi:hypothetical protein
MWVHGSGAILLVSLKRLANLFKIEREGEKLDRPLSSSGLWWVDDNDETYFVCAQNTKTQYASAAQSLLTDQNKQNILLETKKIFVG